MNGQNYSRCIHLKNIWISSKLETNLRLRSSLTYLRYLRFLRFATFFDGLFLFNQLICVLSKFNRRFQCLHINNIFNLEHCDERRKVEQNECNWRITSFIYSKPCCIRIRWQQISNISITTFRLRSGCHQQCSGTCRMICIFDVF